MMIAIWGVLGLVIGAGLGFFIGGGTEESQLMLTIHLTIAIGFVGLWLGVVCNKSATHHEECHGPLKDS